jgi:hypothetical protein
MPPPLDREEASSGAAFKLFLFLLLICQKGYWVD